MHVDQRSMLIAPRRGGGLRKHALRVVAKGEEAGEFPQGHFHCYYCGTRDDEGQMMILRTAMLSTMALWFTAPLVMADEVLYCADTAVVGFKWDNTGKAATTKFTNGRYTVEVISNAGRAITPVVGDTAGRSRNYTCHSARVPEDQIVCDEQLVGGDLWVFYKNNYTHGYLGGPLVGPSDIMDPNIWIAYGTCVHF
jgi:hypothetical protein